MGVNSLTKTVTRQRRGCDLNPGPSAPESSTLTTRLPSHLRYSSLTNMYNFQICFRPELVDVKCTQKSVAWLDISDVDFAICLPLYSTRDAVTGALLRCVCSELCIANVQRCVEQTSLSEQCTHRRLRILSRPFGQRRQSWNGLCSRQGTSMRGFSAWKQSMVGGWSWSSNSSLQSRSHQQRCRGYDELKKMVFEFIISVKLQKLLTCTLLNCDVYYHRCLSVMVMQSQLFPINVYSYFCESLSQKSTDFNSCWWTK